MSEPTADIVVTVRDARDDTARCLDAIEAHTHAPHRVIVVNDGSAAPTAAMLRARSEAGRVTLIDWTRNRGYTAAVNAGLARSSAPFAVLLNSDTVVTEGWLEGLLRCAATDPRIGAVGPLSNAATFQSVPAIRHPAGGFAINTVTDPGRVAARVRAVAERSYPRVPFLNGFCLLLRREAREAAGPFDVYAFPRGYGEENDYAIRLRDEGYELAVADDVYVFHRKSRSFGHDARRTLARAGHRALFEKHGRARVDADIQAMEDNAGMRAVRRRVQLALTPPARSVRRLLFLLPVRGGAGGAHSVLQEAGAMRTLGVDVRVAIQRAHLRHFRRTYRGAPDMLSLLQPFSETRELVRLACDYDAVVATVYASVRLLGAILDAAPHVLPAYYVQDYEPWFFPDDQARRKEALDSYTHIPGCVLFAKTDWIARAVTDAHGVPVRRVRASVDHALYHPDPGRPERPIVVAAMVRPKTVRRGAARTMRVLARAHERFGDLVRIEIFGARRLSRGFRALPRRFPHVMHGVLRREQVAAFLRRAHVFVDLSEYQAFGRTGIEAMASGCAVINPVRGGTDEYCVDGENSLLVDTRSDDACFEALARLIEDDALRERVSSAGIETAGRYSIRDAAESELRALDDASASLRQRLDTSTSLASEPTDERIPRR